jgi:hypothetical protein
MLQNKEIPSVIHDHEVAIRRISQLSNTHATKRNFVRYIVIRWILRQSINIRRETRVQFILLHTICSTSLLERCKRTYSWPSQLTGSSGCLPGLGSLVHHHCSQDCHHLGRVCWGCLLGKGNLGNPAHRIQGWHQGMPGLGSPGNLGYHLGTQEDLAGS